MKKTIFVLTFAVIVLAAFGFDKKKENDQLALALSGQYANNMADASEKLQELDTAVKKTLLFNESDGSAKAKEDIWRLSSDIKSSMSTLPLHPEFSASWMNYLGRLGNYAKVGEHLDGPDKFHTVMNKASKNLNSLSEEWQLATAGIVNGNLSMKGWESKLSAEDADVNWSKMGKSVQQYTEADFPLTASESDSQKKKDLKNIEDQKVTSEQAVKRFKELFPSVSNEVLDVNKSQPGSPYPFFHIRFAENESIGYIDITEKGGHVLSYLSERPVSNEVLDDQSIKHKANQFLKDAGYTDVVLEEARENSNAWHLVYVRVEPAYKAKVFSDTIHIKMAKDNGAVVGLDAAEYIRKETLKKQPVTEIDWNTFFHSNIKIEKKELAYVENEHMDQRLAHYLTVTSEEHGIIGTYSVVVDTETKEVIKTEKL